MNKDSMRVKHRIVIELAVISILSIVTFILSAKIDTLELLVKFSQQHESWELDEIIPVFIFLTFASAYFSFRRWLEIKRSDELLKMQHEKLKSTMSEIKQLRKILPICSSCKKIRDDNGNWHQVEEYIGSHAGTAFSHGICPDCIEKLYPGLSG